MKDFRRFFMLVVVCFLWISFLGCVSVNHKASSPVAKKPVVDTDGYSYEGPLSPDEFEKWTEVNRGVCKGNHLHLLFQNPDPKAKIKFVDVAFIAHPKSREENTLMVYHYSYEYLGGLYSIQLYADGSYRQEMPKLTKQ